MTSWRYSAAALTIFVGACDIYLDVTVQTPKIEIAAAEGTVGGNQGSLGGANVQTRELRLPLCDLVRCVSGDCTTELENRLRANTSDTWRLLDGRPTEVEKFTEGGYFVAVTTSASDKAISESWANVACIRGDLNVNGPLASRTRQCFRHMNRWAAASITGPVELLISESRFRSTCLRSS